MGRKITSKDYAQYTDDGVRVVVAPNLGVRLEYREGDLKEFFEHSDGISEDLFFRTVIANRLNQDLTGHHA